MAFWGEDGAEEQDRCSTWPEAEAMHARMVAQVATPRAVWSYIGRHVGKCFKEAGEDWRELWRELRGKEEERSDDPLWQNVRDSMRRLKELQKKRSFE